jgi:hypothetical protein
MAGGGAAGVVLCWCGHGVSSWVEPKPAVARQCGISSHRSVGQQTQAGAASNGDLRRRCVRWQTVGAAAPA